MTKPVPAYRDRDAVYRADTCTPLVAAARDGAVRFRAFARGHYPGDRLPAAMLPGLKSAGYWDAAGPQQWGLDWHRNEGIEITFLETGAHPFAVDGRDWPLEAGDLTITRPWQEHRVGAPHIGAGRLHWFILDVGIRRPDQPWRWPAWIVLSAHDLAELTDMLRHNEQPVWPANATLRHGFTGLGQALDLATPTDAQSRLTVHLNEILLALLEMLRTRSIPLNPHLASTRRNVALFLEEFARDTDAHTESWTVEALAAECGLGVTAFTRHCKEIANLTPIEYLNRLRLDRAQELLQNEPTRPITDIALACGFHSSQYFATLYKKRFGISPKHARTRPSTPQ